MRIKKYWIHLSSTDGSGDNGNFNIQFNNSIFSTLTPKDRIFVYPVRITMPYSWPTITNGKNIFKIKLAGNSSETTITLPVGSPSSVYDLAEAVDAVLKQVNTNINFTWDNYKKKFIFSYTAGLISYIDFTNYPDIGKLLGFNPEKYTLFTNGTFLEASASPDITTTTYIKCISNLSRRAFSIVNGVMSNSQVFMSFSVKNDSIGNNIIYENNGSEEFMHEIDSNINSAYFKFIDGNSGELMDVKNPVEIILGVIVEKHEGDDVKDIIGKIKNMV